MVNISLLLAVEILGGALRFAVALPVYRQSIQVCACLPLILHANEASARLASERAAIAKADDCCPSIRASRSTY
jgi:hypothetical protein